MMLCGSAARRAIARSGPRDFWVIARTRHLRRETKNHIPAILAATILSKEPAKYGLTYDPEPALRYDTFELDGAVDLLDGAKIVLTDADDATLDTLWQRAKASLAG